MAIAVIATWVTRQLLFNGMISGLVFGLLAMGIVLIYRSTRVINFAVANMGLPASALLALTVLQYNFPFWPALALSVAVGVVLGAVLELVVIRRLFSAPRVVVLVATIGIAQLCAYLPFTYPDIDTKAGQRYPIGLDLTIEDFFGLRVQGPQLSILVLAPLIAIALALFLNRTTFGQTVQASADNPDLARLSAISPKLVSTTVWTIAGLLATVSTILLSGLSGSVAGIVSLGPSTMVRALAASVIGGMRSFPAAMAAGVGIGVAQSLLRFNFLGQTGLIDFLLFLAVVVAVFVQGRRDVDDESSYSFVPKTRPMPEHLRDLRIVRWLVPMLFAGAVALAVVAPLLVSKPSRHLLYASICAYAICGLSVTVVTGWSGQVALGQMAFAGIGALLAAALLRAGVPFALTLVFGALTTAVLAAVIGIGALRIKGLLLAVSTFTFGLAAERYLFKQNILSDGNTSSVPFERGTIFGVSLDDQRSYYWFSLAVLLLVTAVVVRLRNSGIGRTTIAVRDNETSAAAYTVQPVRVRLLSFALAGAIAGLGGAMLGGLVQSVPLGERFFQNADSLRLIAMVVIGGIGSVAGAILGALWVVGLPAIFPDNDVLPFLTSTLGLLIVLMYFPGGFAERLTAMRGWLFDELAKRIPAPAESSGTGVPQAIARPLESTTRARPATLAADNVTVRFGGNVAVDEATIRVDDGEVVGLIGTNGAGKSTLMNAIGGFVPSSGVITLGGVDVSSRPPTARASLGLGRTFQAAKLFPELSVRECVLVALEARGRSGFVSTLTFWPPAVATARHRRGEADELIDFLGLGRFADQYVSDLSTGTRRIVELAGLLALEARVLCLDEPTAGVAQRETEAFGPLLLAIRLELDASILVIEHDMPLIMSISDRVYCLESGIVIAEGAPEQVRNDPRVIGSYLGTDSRAIERSDSARDDTVDVRTASEIRSTNADRGANIRS